MIYLLDTNACIHHLKFADSPVTRKLSIHLPETAVYSVTKAELFYGAMRSNNPTKTIRQQQEFLELFVSLPCFSRVSLRMCWKAIAVILREGAIDSAIATLV